MKKYLLYQNGEIVRDYVSLGGAIREYLRRAELVGVMLWLVDIDGNTIKTNY